MKSAEEWYDQYRRSSPIGADAVFKLIREVQNDARAELVAWKESAIAVMLDHQRIGRLLDFPLGTDIRTENVCERIEALPTHY